MSFTSAVSLKHHFISFLCYLSQIKADHKIFYLYVCSKTGKNIHCIIILGAAQQCTLRRTLPRPTKVLRRFTASFCIHLTL